MKVLKWKYITRTISHTLNSKELSEKLNVFGEQGYELVGIYGGDVLQNTIVVLKIPNGYLEI